MRLVKEVEILTSKNEYLRVTEKIEAEFAIQLINWQKKVDELKPLEVKGFRLRMGAMDDWFPNSDFLLVISKSDRESLLSCGYGVSLHNLEEGEFLDWDGVWGASRITGETQVVSPKVPSRPELLITEYKSWLNKSSAKNYFEVELKLKFNDFPFWGEDSVSKERYYIAERDTSRIKEIAKWTGNKLVDGYFWCMCFTYERMVYHLHENKLQVYSTEGKSRLIHDPSYHRQTVGDAYEPKTSVESDGFWNK